MSQITAGQVHVWIHICHTIDNAFHSVRYKCDSDQHWQRSSFWGFHCEPCESGRPQNSVARANQMQYCSGSYSQVTNHMHFCFRISSRLRWLRWSFHLIPVDTLDFRGYKCAWMKRKVLFIEILSTQIYYTDILYKKLHLHKLCKKIISTQIYYTDAFVFCCFAGNGEPRE